jgi:hypothetical protein
MNTSGAAKARQRKVHQMQTALLNRIQPANDLRSLLM